MCFCCSYMDTEKYEEAVRDYEKITKMDHNHGMLFSAKCPVWNNSEHHWLKDKLLFNTIVGKSSQCNYCLPDKKSLFIL